MFDRSQYGRFLIAIEHDQIIKMLAVISDDEDAAAQALDQLQAILAKPMPAELGGSESSAGVLALNYALKMGSYNVARFLVEIMRVDAGQLPLAHLEPPKKVVSARRFNKFVQLLLAESTPHRKSKQFSVYCRKRIQSALEVDDADELQYLAQINRDLLLEYLDHSQRNVFQSATQLGALNCLRYLLAVFSDHRYFPDQDGNSLPHQAVRAEKLEVVQYLMDDELYDADNDTNRLGQTVLATAQACKNPAILAYVHQRLDPKSLRVMPEGLNLSSYVQGDDLTIKGQALLLHHFASKKPGEPLAFTVWGKDDKRGTLLARIFDLFVRSTSDSLHLYFDDDVHGLAYRCERVDGKVYIFVQDSMTGWADRDAVLNRMIESYLGSLSKIVFCVNDTRQQTADLGCHYYGDKNISMWMSLPSTASTTTPTSSTASTPSTAPASTPSYYRELSEGKYFTSQVDNMTGVEIRHYRLPARFMHVTTSPAQLAEYVKKYPEEAKKIVRKTKDGVPQTLMEWCLHPRKGHGMETPEKVRNLNYKPHSEEKEPEFILKNNSLWWSRNKYVTHTIPKMVKEHTEEECALMLSYYNAENMMLSPKSGKVASKHVVRVLSSGGKNKFTFLPRPSAPVAEDKGAEATKSLASEQAVATKNPKPEAR